MLSYATSRVIAWRNIQVRASRSNGTTRSLARQLVEVVADVADVGEDQRQQLGIELAPDDARHLQRTPRRLGEAVDTAQHQRVQAAGQRDVLERLGILDVERLLTEEVDELLDVERVALGAIDDQLDQRLGRSGQLAELLGDLRAYDHRHGVVVELGQLELLEVVDVAEWRRTCRRPGVTRAGTAPRDRRCPRTSVARRSSDGGSAHCRSSSATTSGSLAMVRADDGEDQVLE